MSSYGLSVDFSELKGEMLVRIEGMENGSDDVKFFTKSGKEFHMWHCQDCCENVAIYDVCGHVDDLLFSPILEAYEETNADEPEGFSDNGTFYDESRTWTFYVIRTAKGTVTLRWLGESNGYYSESVDFHRVK